MYNQHFRIGFPIPTPRHDAGLFIFCPAHRGGPNCSRFDEVSMNRLIHAAARITLLLVLALQAHAGLITQSGPKHFLSGGGQTLSHGDTFTITGSGFGTAPAAADFLQPTIEATSVGSPVSLSAPWGQPDAPVAIFEGFDDSVRARTILAEYDAVSAFDVGILWDRGGNAAANEDWYATYWIRRITLGPNAPAEEDDGGGTSFPGGENWQWKLWRIRFNNSVNDSFGSGDGLASHWDNEDGSYITFGPGEGGPTGSFHYINGADSQTNPDPPTIYNDGISRMAGGDDLPTIYRDYWFRVEVHIDFGTGATGAVRMRVYHETPNEWRHVANLQDIDFLGGSRAFRYFIAQNFIGNVDTPGENFTGTTLAVDDFYVQRGNLKHIELCASATLSSCTWREVQDFATWSDTQITGPLNTGAGRGGTLYLHVVEMNLTTGSETSLGSAEVTVT